MDASILLKGLIIGFAMAVPIGPLGVLCIRKTLTEGRARGMVIGLGAATADALYSGIAAFGLTIVLDVIEGQEFWVRLVGGLLLLVLGIRTLRAKRTTDPLKLFDSRGLWGIYVSSFVIALTNPLTIFAFIAVFATFGLAHERGFVEASLLVLGVFTGSGLWFLTLGSVATMFHGRITAGGMRWVSRIAGILIIVSGIVLFVGAI
jgi:threonine/homoserine/homoserine lactone efflux protein